MENADVLRVVYQNTDTFVSGEQMASLFKISRAAISKRIEKLKEKGIQIDAVTHKGYKLKYIPDKLMQENVRLGVPDEQLVGKIVHCMEEIDSTNEYAKREAIKFEDGTVVVASRQTKGKGRKGKSFSSQDGGLYMSIILKPDVTVEKVPFITQICACSVYKALEDLGVKTDIKWPNDIILNDKKLCGILCEMSCEVDFLNYIVVGIGINISDIDFSDDLSKIATSLEKEGHKFQKVEIFWKILEHFDYFYTKYKENDYTQIIKILKENSYIIGKKISVLSGENIKKAIAKDMDENGFLVVEYEDSSIEHLNYGEISIRKAN